VKVLFAGSGCAALIYEVVWYQQLQLVLGSTTIALAILLATFMGGLCLGSLILPRVPIGGRDPMRVFAAIEGCIAICGAMVILGMPLIARANSALAALVMLPATVFMGASFPAIVRAVERRPGLAATWAVLYGSNTAGAVFGCLLAGFFLLRFYSMATAGWVAVGLNLAAAALSIALSGRTTEAPSIEEACGDGCAAWTIYTSIALSGFCALGAEVIWTRLLGILFLGTVYVFAIILAVFLSGLAAGGALSSRVLRRGYDPASSLAVCQFLLAASIVWAAIAIDRVLPDWSGTVALAVSPWRTSLYHLVLAAVAILPATLLWGASFPLACAAALRRAGGDPARVAGRVYAANTLGAIGGALLVSVLLVPAIGTQGSQRVLVVLSIVAAVVSLWPAGLRVIAAAAVALCLVAAIPPVSGEVIAYGRYIYEQTGRSEVLFAGEGINSSVAITRWPNGTVYINVNGHVEATTEQFDMRLQRMVGHLPGLLHPAPKSVLGIGFGAGVSAGTFTRYPSVEHITVCEIEPLIPPTSDRFFRPQNDGVYRDPRTRIVFDDARHYLMTTRETFDVIASDPLDVFIKGTAALYTREYFEAVKSRLNPGGYFSLYVPLYETDEPTIKSELRTFFSVFPNGTVWSNTREGLGYDLVFLGQAEAFLPDLDQVERRFERPDYSRVRESLGDLDMRSVYDLLGTYLSSGASLKAWTADAQLNTDADLRLSYLAGWGANADLADDHYRNILKYRGEPRQWFTGSPTAMAALEESMRRTSD
jgi:spermidine synthase